VNNFFSMTKIRVAQTISNYKNLILTIKVIFFQNNININEHKKTSKSDGESGCEGIIGVLLRLLKEGGLQFPITNDNIKDIISVRTIYCIFLSSLLVLFQFYFLWSLFSFYSIKNDVFLYKK